MRELMNNEELKIGDEVDINGIYSKYRLKVVRLTKTMAVLSRYSTRMPIKYSTFSWRAKGSNTWSQTTYKAFREEA